MADEGPMQLHLIENGYLVALLWDRAKAGDPRARGIYRKLRDHAIGLGVYWGYADPWPMDDGKAEE